MTSLRNRLVSQYSVMIADLKSNHEIQVKQKAIENERKAKTYERKLSDYEKKIKDLKNLIDKIVLQSNLRIKSLV